MIRLALAAASMAAPAAAEPAPLHAAGSLRAALSEVAADFTAAEGAAVATTFAASGAWVTRERRANLFTTCGANAVLAQAEAPALGIVSVPPALAVGADDGLT